MSTRGRNVVAVVVPVHRNEATLGALTARVGSALDGRAWRLRLVIDASPDGSLAEARRLAADDERVRVTVLDVNVGQHAALTKGLAAEEGASAWACLDADLQDPPEAIPLLLARLEAGDVGAVFAGRRGAYEGIGRRLTGRLHRAALSRLSGLPADAGAFVVMDGTTRRAVVDLDGPSIVASIGAAGVRVASLPVERAERAAGTSSWTGRARLRQSARTLSWSLSRRR